MLPRPVTVAELCDLYCLINVDITSPGTKHLYHAAERAFSAFLGRTALLSDLEELTFAKFLTWRAGRVAPATLRGDAAKILAAWRWAAGGSRRWIDGPDCHAPPVVSSPPIALTRDQMAQLWAAAHASRWEYAGVPCRVYWPAVLWLLWDTSERIGAVLQLHRGSVAGQWVEFPAAIRKGGRVGRQYKIRRETAVAFDFLLAATDKAQPLALRSPGTFYHHWRRLVREAGLPPWVRPHTIRKSHATHLTIAGGDARASLGHSSEAITDMSYRDPRIIGENTRQPCDLLFNPLRPGFWGRLFG